MSDDDDDDDNDDNHDDNDEDDDLILMMTVTTIFLMFMMTMLTMLPSSAASSLSSSSSTSRIIKNHQESSRIIFRIIIGIQDQPSHCLLLLDPTIHPLCFPLLPRFPLLRRLHRIPHSPLLLLQLYRVR
jgi:hypothetical protein